MVSREIFFAPPRMMPMMIANSIGRSENAIPLPPGPLIEIFCVPMSSATTMITRHRTWTFQSFRLKFSLNSFMVTYLSLKTVFIPTFPTRGGTAPW